MRWDVLANCGVAAETVLGKYEGPTTLSYDAADEVLNRMVEVNGCAWERTLGWLIHQSYPYNGGRKCKHGR